MSDFQEEVDVDVYDEDESFPTLAEVVDNDDNDRNPFVSNSSKKEDISPKEGEQQEETKSSFASILSETFGWEDVPEDVEPVTALKAVTDMYEQELANLKQQLEQVQSNKVPDELIQYEESFAAFKALTPREALIATKMQQDFLTQEEAEEEVNDLELEGKLDKEYRKISRKMERQYQEGIEVIKEKVAQQQAYQKQQEELAYQQEIVAFNSTLAEFKSDYLEITPKDKEFLKEAFLKQDNQGMTLIDKMLADTNVTMEMVMAYFKMQDLKTLPNKIKKQVANELVNGMSNEPIFNAKQKEDFDVIKDYWERQDDED